MYSVHTYVRTYMHMYVCMCIQDIGLLRQWLVLPSDVSVQYHYSTPQNSLSVCSSVRPSVVRLHISHTHTYIRILYILLLYYVLYILILRILYILLLYYVLYILILRILYILLLYYVLYILILRILYILLLYYVLYILILRILYILLCTEYCLLDYLLQSMQPICQPLCDMPLLHTRGLGCR